MSLRSVIFGLLVTVAPLLLAACQGAPAQTAAPVIVIPTADPASPSTPEAAAPAPFPTFSPTATASPSAQGALEEPSATNDVPGSKDIIQHTPSPQPTTNHTGEPPAPATQPTSGQQPAQPAVFYQKNGLTLEYYWPLDDRSNLSADETEILAYNESNETVEFVLPRMSFVENGSPRGKFSGTWEKFPSRYSWDRIEYISIPPSSYRGEPLLLGPCEKAKIHWHLESIVSADTYQLVELELAVARGTGTETITQTLVRDSDQRNPRLLPPQVPPIQRPKKPNRLPVMTFIVKLATLHPAYSGGLEI